MPPPPLSYTSTSPLDVKYLFYIFFHIINFMYLFRVIHVVGHHIADIEEHGRITRSVMMLVYTEESILLLSVYPLHALLYGQN